MITLIAQTLTAGADGAPPPNLLDSLTPILAIFSLAFGLWQRFKALDYQTMLRAAAVGMKAALDSIPERKAEEIKSGIKEAVGPLNEAMKAEVRKATAPAVKAYSDEPPAPPRLGALLLVVTLLLGAASGCVSAAARDLAVTHYEHVVAFDGASVPHPSYTVDDAEPGPDGRKLTAAEKLKAWRDARAEVLASARALAEALK